jgi:hypothetical protein
MALSAPMTMTDRPTARGESMLTPGRIAAVAARETNATTKETVARQSSCVRPRLQFQISSIWAR